ncbi:MAG: hypothetical protein AAF661_03430 [Pseudomonadota bacterium]
MTSFDHAGDAELVAGGCVAFLRNGEWRGALIRGPSGAGKSTLAVRLIALGGKLVSDDQTTLRRQGDAVLATAPAAIAGLLELRGTGLLRLPYEQSASISHVVDLSPNGQPAPERCPAPRNTHLLDMRFPLLCMRESSATASALAVLMTEGRLEDPDAAVEEMVTSGGPGRSA